MSLKIPYSEFCNRGVISGFSSNTLKLTWVCWKCLSFLKSTTISSEINHEYLWIKVTKFMTAHRQIPSKIKPRLFTLCFNRANDRAKFDYWGFEKTLLFFHSISDDMDRGFLKQAPWKYWPKKLLILTSWGTGKKLVLREFCWLTSSNLLPNYL